MKHFLSISTFMLLASVAVGVQVTVYVSPARCNLNNGRVNAIADGGVPPYSFQWSNGSTGQTIQDLAPGDYTVTVTDGLNNTDQITATVEAVFAMGSGGTAIQLQPDCQNMCTGIAVTPAPFGGVEPYNYPPDVIEGGFGPEELTIMGLCGPSFGTITIWDANGCPGEIDITGVIMPTEPSSITVQATSPACEGESNGSMTILMDGPFASIMEVIRVGGGYSQLHYPAWNVPYTITDLPPGDFELISSMIDVGSGGVGTLCSSTFTGSVPEIPGPCGGVSGRIYHDANEDCTLNGFDLGLPYRILSIEPGNQFAITDGNGNYQRNLDFGTYTIAQSANPNEEPICPVTGSASFTVEAGNPTVISDFANLSSSPLDLAVSVHSSNARPGFQTQVWVSVRNLSAFPSDNVTLDLTFDGLLLNPTPINGQWDLGAIAPYGFASRTFHALVPANVNLLGIQLTYVATVTNPGAETNTTNNTAITTVTVTGSYDPNDKTGRTSTGFDDNLYFADIDEWIDYTIRFQNTGTAAAETVVIRDTIESDLDISSLEILGATHAFTPSFNPDRSLSFTFNNINLPDSTSDLAGSQGAISFRIKPRAGITIGDVLENTAAIYFDFNPPIFTNTTSHAVDYSTSILKTQHTTLHVSPNPAADVIRVTVEGNSTAVQIFGMDGRKVNAPATKRSNGWNMDVTDLDPGTYILRTEYGSASFVKR